MEVIPLTARGTIRDAETTTRWLAAVAEGTRVVTKSRLKTLLGWTESTAERCIPAWERAGWIRPMPERSGIWVVGSACPGAPDDDTLEMEILLAMAAPRTPQDRLGLGYRTALQLHGLCQEFGDGVVFVCHIGRERRVPMQAEPLPFQRITSPLSEPDCQSGRLRGYVVQRDTRALERGLWHRTDTGLRITGAARTLVDCWLRPAYGVDDERWTAAWQAFWADDRFGSRAQKGADLLAIHQGDADSRAGRSAAFARLIEPFVPDTARVIRESGP